MIDAQQLLRPGTTDVPAAVAAEIARAASSWGFFQLVNHGSDVAVLQRMTRAMHSFFDLPLETKLQVRGRAVFQRAAAPLVRGWHT